MATNPVTVSPTFSLARSTRRRSFPSPSRQSRIFSLHSALGDNVLSFCFSTKLTDSPGFVGFPGENGKLVYGEGIYVGYRHPGFSTIFPFGTSRSHCF